MKPMAWTGKIAGWLLIGAAVFALTVSGRAAWAHPTRVRTLAMITWRGKTDAERGFLDGLDRNTHPISIQTHHAAQSVETLYQIIRIIQKHPVDLIYVFGTTATQIVLSQIKTTPVIFNVVSLPVATGIIGSWQASGCNAVGVSNQVPVRQQLKAFLNTCAFRRLGIIFNPLEQNSLAQKEQVETLGQAFGFSLHAFPIARKDDIPKKLSGLTGRVDAVYIPADSLIKSLGDEIVSRLNAQKIPSMSAVESMVPDDGVLLERGNQFVNTAAEMQVVSSGKVFGLFDMSHMQPDIDRQYFAEEEPSIAEMTAKAIELLSKDTLRLHTFSCGD